MQIIMLHGSETWILNIGYEKRLNSIEIDFWRRSAITSRLEFFLNSGIREIIHVKQDVLQTFELIFYFLNFYTLLKIID